MGVEPGVTGRECGAKAAAWLYESTSDFGASIGRLVACLGLVLGVLAACYGGVGLTAG